MSNPWRRLVDPATLEYFYVNKDSKEKFWEDNKKGLWIRKERPLECRYVFYENRLTSQRCFLDDPTRWKILTSKTYNRPYWHHESGKYSSWVDPVTWVPQEGKKWWNPQLQESRNTSPFRGLSRKLKKPRKNDAATPESTGSGESNDYSSNDDIRVWTVYVDPKTKHRFFYNSHSGKRQWDVPKDENSWIVGETKAGRKYFFNPATKTSVWKLPSSTPKRRHVPPSRLDVSSNLEDDAKTQDTPPHKSLHDEQMRINAQKRWSSAVDKIKSALRTRRSLLMSPMSNRPSSDIFERPSREVPLVPPPIVRALEILT